MCETVQLSRVCQMSNWMTTNKKKKKTWHACSTHTHNAFDHIESRIHSHNLELMWLQTKKLNSHRKCSHTHSTQLRVVCVNEMHLKRQHRNQVTFEYDSGWVDSGIGKKDWLHISILSLWLSNAPHTQSVSMVRRRRSHDAATGISSRVKKFYINKIDEEKSWCETR